MPTMTTSIFGNAIARGSTMSLGYVLGLAEDIPADHWHDKCMDGMNHPAFIYGHLAIYPNRVLGAFLDREDLVVECPFDAAPLGQGEDGGGDQALYPAKDLVLPFMKERYETIIGILPEVPSSVFSAPNPMEGKFAEMLPTRGDAVSFMMNNHIMMHAGQVSFWRRAMGMGSLNP